MIVHPWRTRLAAGAVPFMLLARAAGQSPAPGPLPPAAAVVMPAAAAEGTTVAPAPNVAPASADADYGALIARAVEEFEAERFLEARALFRAAHALSPNARTLRGMGVTAFELRAYAEAYVALSSALVSDVRPLTETQRIEVEGLVRACEPFIARYDVAHLPAGATLTVDGTEPAYRLGSIVVLDLGSHQLTVRAAGRPAEARVDVVGGESAVLPIDLSPLGEDFERGRQGYDFETPRVAPNRAPRIAAWSTVGVGGGTTALGVLFVALGHTQIARVEGAARDTAWSDLADDYAEGPTRVRAGVSLLGIGATTLGVGLPLALRNRDVVVTLVPAPHALHVVGRFR